MGLRQLLPELPVGGFSVKMPRKSLRSTKTAVSSHHRTMASKMSPARDTSGLPKAEEYELDPDVQIDGRGSQIDPVRAL